MKTKLRYSTLLLFISIFTLISCTKDDDSENLYTEVSSNFDYDIDDEFKTVSFYNLSQGAGSFLWDFGNGNTSTEVNPVVTYDEIGTYQVVLTAINPEGEQAVSSQEITINTYYYPLNFPITFEDEQNDYSFESFGNAEATRIPNPDMSGLNTSSYVASFAKPAGAETWAGTTLQVEEAIDFVSYNTIKVKTWSPLADAVVMLKVEDSSDPDIFMEVTATTSVANEWEELTFTYSDVDPENSYDKVSIFFNFGSEGLGNTYYFDDLSLSMEEVNPCIEETTPNAIDPENGNISITFINGENPIDAFGNTEIAVVSNPLINDTNNSCNVLKYVKNSSAEDWAGTAISGGLTSAFAPANQPGNISLKVLSPIRTGNITIRMEFMPHPDVDPSVSITVPTTIVGEWEELNFDFSEHVDKTFMSMVIYVDEGVAGDDAIFYLDDIIQQ